MHGYPHADRHYLASGLEYKTIIIKHFVNPPQLRVLIWGVHDLSHELPSPVRDEYTHYGWLFQLPEIWSPCRSEVFASSLVLSFASEWVALLEHFLSECSFQKHKL